MRSTKYPIVTILAEAENACNNLKANVESFAIFGFGQERYDVFRQDIDTAKAIPDNMKATIELKESTDRKNEVLEECFIWCNNLKFRMELAFGVKSEEYDLFPTKQLQDAKRSEEIMLSVMDTCLDISAKKATPLLVFGQTIEVHNEGVELKSSLYELNADQEMQKKENRATTKDRQEIFIRLYDTVNQINQIGRKIYANDPAKLELFKSPWPKRAAKVETEEQ